MTEHAEPSRPDTGSLEILFEREAGRALILNPERPVELPARNGKRRFAFARVGLAVIAISGLALVPVTSLAEGAADQPPVVTSDCQITSALEDGTPSGVLADGGVCVLPAGGETPAPGAEPPPPSPAAEPTTPGTEPPSARVQAPAAEEGPKAPSRRAGSPAKTTSGKRKRPARHGGRRKRSRALVREQAKRRRSSARRPGKVAPSARTGSPQPAAATTPFYVSDEAVIPRFLIHLYKQAGRRYDVPWPVLAAINEIETDFGRNVAVSSAGAMGWMQFMPATWRTYGVDADHDGVKDPGNPRDAIFAAARYLRAAGAPDDMRRAIFAYNRAGWYVDSVLLRAERIASQEGVRSPRLRRLLRASERSLTRKVLADSRIRLYPCGREDIAARRIDRRVLVVLRFLASSGLHPTVTSLQCGHRLRTASGNISAHSSGNAVDIAAINGVPIAGNQGSGSVTDATIRELLTLGGAMKPAQIISLMTIPGADSTLAMEDHADHIHVGFRPVRP